MPFWDVSVSHCLRGFALNQMKHQHTRMGQTCLNPQARVLEMYYCMKKFRLAWEQQSNSSNKIQAANAAIVTGFTI